MSHSSSAAGGPDVRTLAALVSQPRPDLPPRGLPRSLLSDLAEHIACDGISFYGFDSAARHSWFAQEIPDGDVAPEVNPLEPIHWAHYWQCEPCSYPDRSGDLRSIVTIRDFYSARQWRSTGMYSEVYRPQGIEHELMLTLPPRAAPGPGAPAATRPGRTLRLFLFRGPGPDFTDTDRALLTLLRPHLHHAYRDAEQRRHPHQPPQLTPRQWQLLTLVAAGHTNTQIARRLHITEGTVRTHLEMIYRRLHVTNRTAAVTRAFERLPVAPSGT